MTVPRLSKGIIAINKPKGVTSYDVIRQLKKHFPEEKIGHGGTLDPLAEGVLVVGIGKDATKRLQHVLTGTHKTYEAVIELGSVSETDDAEGPVITSYQGQAPATEDITNILKKYTGTISQTPPHYSAVKIQGVPAYTRSRRGEEFVIEPKTVNIDQIELLTYAHPILSIRVVSGSGVYIRSLARDIGRDLGTGAYLKELKRTSVGKYDLSTAIDLLQ